MNRSMNMHYISSRGGIAPVGFKDALLQGFAADGGLFIPQQIPRFSRAELEEMRSLGFTDLAYRLIRPYIPVDEIPDQDLKKLLLSSFASFTDTRVAPVIRKGPDHFYIQELFHGPTQSFKDIAMGFLVGCMDYFLQKDQKSLSLILATTGDTGPAAVAAAAGKKSMNCWPLFPQSMISEEQRRQMTTVDADNIHPVAVTECANGGDDLDIVVARMFNEPQTKSALKLSSVNSINWGRVMMQVVHYFSGYFQTVDSLDQKVIFSVPAGAFGNLCAGSIARKMGLPVETFICATNRNQTLHQIFGQGRMHKNQLIQTVSSAIDIVLPYNFWRFLSLHSPDPSITKTVMDRFEQEGHIEFEPTLYHHFAQGFSSVSVSDEQTLSTMRDFYHQYNYLLDPHGSVAVSAAREQQQKETPIICMVTAHPAKFPDITSLALGEEVARENRHPAIEATMQKTETMHTCSCHELQETLTELIQTILAH